MLWFSFIVQLCKARLASWAGLAWLLPTFPNPWVSICLSTPLHLSDYPPTRISTACMPVRLPSCLHVYLPVCLYAFLPIRLFVCLCIYLPICMHFCMHVYLSVYLSDGPKRPIHKKIKVHLSVCQPYWLPQLAFLTACLSVCLSTGLHACLFASPSACLYLSVSLAASMSMPVCMSACISASLPVCLCTSVSVYPSALLTFMWASYIYLLIAIM